MMKIAFYRAAHGNWIDRLIDRLSGERGYSHSELIFSDGVPFSSTTRDPSIDPFTGKMKSDGTRFKWISYKPERWAMLDLPVSVVQEQAIRRKAESMLGARYDYRGVMRFVLPFVPQGRREYFCTEADIVACQDAFLFPAVAAWKESPNSIALAMGAR